MKIKAQQLWDSARKGKRLVINLKMADMIGNTELGDLLATQFIVSCPRRLRQSGGLA